MDNYLGTCALRNVRHVYETRKGYKVVQVDSRGNEHASLIPAAAVERLFRVCKGETVTAEEAAYRMEPYARSLSLNYHYGWKLRMLVQDIFMVLVVTGRATVTKNGNLFLYRVK